MSDVKIDIDNTDIIIFFWENNNTYSNKKGMNIEKVYIGRGKE